MPLHEHDGKDVPLRLLRKRLANQTLDDLDSLLRHLLGRNARGGQGRHDELRAKIVITTDDAEILRNPKAVRMCLADDPGSFS